MNGVHDMGGMHGFGPVPWEPDEPPFHHEWERRMWGLMGATTPPEGSTLDAGRHRIERMPPAAYLAASYYERWLWSLTAGRIAAGLLSLEEVEQGRAASGTVPRADAIGPERVDPFVAKGTRREIDAAPRFRVGERVRTANLHPAGHTRLPRYARGKVGEIAFHHGAHVLPDTNAHGQGECPNHLYTVRFSARELWGDDASPRDSVALDVWECRLAAA